MARRLLAVGRTNGAALRKSDSYAQLCCKKCDLTGHELPLAQVEHLIGVHDRLHHGGAGHAFASLVGGRR